MNLFKNGIVVLSLSTMLFASAGCGSTQNKYKVTLYSGNEVVKRWDANKYSTGGCRLYIKESGRKDTVVAGTFVLESTNRALQDRPASVKYKATLYGVEKVLRTWDASSYDVGENRLYIGLPGQSVRDIVISGTYVLEPTNIIPGQAAAPKYKVTLFDSANHVLRTWEIVSYTTGDGGVYLKLPGYGNNKVLIAGTYVVEPIQ